jgi:mono/diheme cytochrome c family protein
LFAALSLLLAACTEPLAPAPVLPTDEPSAIAISDLTPPDPTLGRQIYLDNQCVACHSNQAEGGIGPKLAQTSLPFDQFLDKIRTALPPKPAFDETALSTQDAYHLYGWLESLDPVGSPAAVQPTLPPGQILGMKVWTEGRCDSCHGAFAQGSEQGPVLAGLSFPFELERATMRQTADTIPEHAATHMDDTLLQRLYNWLQAGADPAGGC